MKCSAPLRTSPDPVMRRICTSFSRRIGLACVLSVTMALAMLVLWPADASAASSKKTAASFRPQPTAFVIRDRIVLGDLSPTFPKALVGVDVGPAPNPGKQTTISRASVRNALRRAKANPDLSNGLPASMTIERKSTQLTVDQLEAELRNQLTERLPEGVSITAIRGLRPIVIPLGDAEVSVDFAKLRPSMPVTLRVSVAGRVWGLQQPHITLAGNAKTPVLRKNLPRNAVVGEDDIEMVATDLRRLPNNAVLHKSQLAGQRLRQATQGGRALQTAHTERTPMVQRGKTVTLVARTAGIRITQPALIERDAHFGQWVLVRPLSGNRMVRAKVVSPSEVEIDLGGSL